jgi:hypothetical protein
MRVLAFSVCEAGTGPIRPGLTRASSERRLVSELAGRLVDNLASHAGRDAPSKLVSRCHNDRLVGSMVWSATASSPRRGVEVDLLAAPGTERLHGPCGVIAAAVEAPVNREDYAA